MDEYVENCKNMDMVDWLDLQGNDEYKRDWQNNFIDEDTLHEEHKNDTMYVYKYFDVRTWWRVNGVK
jgi:hypothetical protein